MSILTESLILLAALILSAFFAASEAALLRLRAHAVEQDLATARKPGILAVSELRRSLPRLLVTILLANNVANILATTIASALAIHYFGVDAGVVVATVGMTVVMVVLCEMLPKSVAANNPRRVAYAVGLPLYLVHRLSWPAHIVFDRFLEPVVRRLSGAPQPQAASAVEEILRAVRTARSTERAASPALAIIEAAVSASDRMVGEIMVQRADIVAFPVEMPPSELLERVLEERYTRVPIYNESIDNILGTAHLKDLVRLHRNGGGQLDTILKPVLRVPARKPVLDILGEMQRAFVHVAVVLDEFGGTAGMATQEDILEELVGEIRDEFDRDELLTIRQAGENAYQALGRVRVLDFARETGWSIPAERGDTLSGLLFNRLGRTPRIGDLVEVEGFTLEVLDASGARITQVQVRRMPGAPAGDGEAAP